MLCAVLIDRQSWAEAVTPTWFMCHAFGPFPQYFLNWGDQFWGRVWKTNDPDIAEALCAEIEKTALPKLRANRTIEEFIAAIPHTRGGIFSMLIHQPSL